MSKHAKDWALTAAVPILGATGLGMAGIGPLAGLLGGGSAGALGALGSMGPEQAGLLAAQNEGLGLGATKMTLDAAATAGGTPWGALSTAGNGLSAFGKAQSAMGAMNPQQRNMTAQVQPMQQSQQAQQSQPLYGMTPQQLEQLRQQYLLANSYQGGYLG